jgi:multicomponent K+:H+ antiporter subunit G
MTEIVLPDWIALAAGMLLIAGGLLTFIGACGLVRLRDFYSRMHPPTMGATLGTGCILISSMLVTSAVLDRPVFHEVVITLFILITSPVSAILLMRAAISRNTSTATRPRD